VLLGCRIGQKALLSGAARRRAARAADAFHAGVAPLVVISGGKRWYGVREADALCRELLQSGVPASAILLETRSKSTRQNARFVSEMLRARGARRAGIVTCDWHLPRALGRFRIGGIEAIPLPAASPRCSYVSSLRRRVSERLSTVLDRVLDRYGGAR
jgi:uncharacterized SAM-binding protein YcdF (DUF218 family)